ncbi:MAG: glycosyltransferase family 2 protein [Acholeplasmatales bacterium]|nr:glycosyltransferase family 2 protein [Acholeplasmatales bacterium]
MVGIIILNYNTADDAIECVESIEKTTKLDHKIYIVDNCSKDNSFDVLRTEYDGNPKVEVIQSEINGGFSYGNNVGIKVAEKDGCDYLLISNPDVIYYDGTIDVMCDRLKSDSRIGIIGPSTPSIDQDESQLLRKVYTSSLYFFSKKPFRYLAKVFKSLRTEYPYPNTKSDSLFLFKGMVRGCCFMISTKLFKEIGYFDDNLFLYSEEWIIAKKIYDKGLLCAFDNSVKALHKEATSTKKVGTGFQSFHLYLSAFYYLKYYAHSSKIYLLFVCVQNKTNYFIKSIFSKSYRKLYKKFKSSQNALCFKKKKKIVFDHVE